MTTDPYGVLGLTKSATADEIKKAYRKLVRTSHPDLHPDDAGAEARFKAISSAYDLLKDPETRKRFDAGEIDATGAERPQRQYYRDFA
ncbi:MAG: J domain-containing protein, partial [Rhodobacteraceae bacterium]|nr:J domain-containing protein [Paracoccaceae bacterium]